MHCKSWHQHGWWTLLSRWKHLNWAILKKLKQCKLLRILNSATWALLLHMDDTNEWDFWSAQTCDGTLQQNKHQAKFKWVTRNSRELHFTIKLMRSQPYNHLLIQTDAHCIFFIVFRTPVTKRHQLILSFTKHLNVLMPTFNTTLTSFASFDHTVQWKLCGNAYPLLNRSLNGLPWSPSSAQHWFPRCAKTLSRLRNLVFKNCLIAIRASSFGLMMLNVRMCFP